MSKNNEQADPSPGRSAFRKATKTSEGRRKRPAPFSLRLTDEERQKLEHLAGGRPLGAFAKARIFDGAPTSKPRSRPTQIGDRAALAQLLGMLGNMRLANNLNQIAKAANLGTLPLTPEVEDDLAEACAAVMAMRSLLLDALGKRPRS